MGCNLFQSVFRSAIAIFLVAFSTNLASAQMFGMPPAQAGTTAWKEVTGLVPEEEPLICIVWNESGQLDPEGNKSEKWLANVELQDSLAKLKKAIVKAAEEQGPPLVARFAKDVCWKLFSKAGMISFESIDVEKSAGSGSMILRLGEDEELLTAFLDELMAEAQFESEVVGESKVYLVPESPVPVAIGIHSGYLIAAVGDGQWKKMTGHIDNKPTRPQWLESRLEAVPISRRSQFMNLNIEGLLGMLPPEAAEDVNFKRIRETLALDGLKSASICSGADSTSNISMFHVECEKEDGLASVMNVPEIDRKKLGELPADSLSSLAIRFSPSTILQFFRALAPPEDFEEAMTSIPEMDLEKDFIDHLEGTMRYSLSGVVTSPRQIAIIRIKDELKFKESLEKFHDQLNDAAARRGFEFYEKESKGITVYGVKNSGTDGFWAVHQGELYVSNNSRAIGSHIRKAASASRASVLSTEFGKQILSDVKSMGFDGPIFLQHYDIDQITETVVPLMQGAMAFLPPEFQDNFDFGANDFPPIESLLGLRSTHSMIFKSPNGYTGISRYDTPIPLEFSTMAVAGIGVGMLLPAVQHVREAARRTTSLNNQRQLALALHNYHAANDSFPPAYTVDDDGNPLLSWRVAILPYIDQQDLYDQFHHDEPWDSEHNIQLLDQMPLVLKNPSTAGQPGSTDYVAPMSDDSVLVPGEGTGFEPITDGTANTILLMEVGASQQVPWTSPQDIEIETLESLDQLDNGHPGTVLVAMADGSVRTISKFGLSIEQLIQAAKKSDGGGF